MRVVVTGATGNAGTSTLRALASHGEVESILGIARRMPAVGMPKVEWAAADVAQSDLVPLFRGADAVIHLAWLIQPSRDEAVLHATNVDGSRRVFEAAADAGVGAIVYASSVGAYSPGPKDRAVDESWPTDGIPSSFYARHKAAVERLLDEFEREHPDIRVVRLRPALKFKRASAEGQRRLFAGPFFPSPLLRLGIPVIPDTPRLRFQAVHTHDIGGAYCLAATKDVRGAFNIAAEPVLDPDRLAKLFGARKVKVPAAALRGAAEATWRLRLQPTPSGWVDMALAVPVMDTTRARTELGWTPKRSAEEALLDVVEGMKVGAGAPTPVLEPGRRVRELLSGLGQRQG
jgi:UDP-glucose 4-epimerase